MRRCDTTKYRRRMQRQRENRAIRQQHEMIAAAAADVPIRYVTPDGKVMARVDQMTTEEKESYRYAAIERALAKITPEFKRCPLCNGRFSVWDGEHQNMHALMFNGKVVDVHDDCESSARNAKKNDMRV